jgi:hypothetical protein
MAQPAAQKKTGLPGIEDSRSIGAEFALRKSSKSGSLDRLLAQQRGAMPSTSIPKVHPHFKQDVGRGVGKRDVKDG